MMHQGMFSNAQRCIMKPLATVLMMLTLGVR